MGPGRRNRGQGGHGGNASRDGPATPPQSNDQQDNAVYDGPADNRGRSSSNVRQSPSVVDNSQHRSASRGPPPGQQGQRTRLADATHQARVLSRNVDFGGEAYNIIDNTGYMPTQMMQRSAFGKLGKPVAININSYLVKTFPTKAVYQYDILIGSGEEPRGLIMAAMESKAVVENVGPDFIFDGNKIGWSLVNHQKEHRIMVDLDAERGKAPRIGKDGKVHENKIRVRITKSGAINLEMINAFLDHTAEFSNKVLECINFLDHLLRETPKKVHINLRRSYFARAPDRNDTFSVGQGVEAMKGVYQSLRTAEGKKLVINVDVSNTCFWNQTGFVQLAYQISGENDRNRFLAVSQKKHDKEPPLWQMLKRLARNRFRVKHGKQTQESEAKIWTMKRLSSFNAKEYKFKVKSSETGEETTITLFDYYRTKYGVQLDYWYLPLIESNRDGVLFPMELCYMCAGQRYPYKLNENQTAAMIKFAVSRPPQRRQAIEHGLNMLDWEQDPVLRNYGLKISREMLETRARVLDPPEVLYKNTTAKPGFSGRWDLRGKVFFKPNEAPLKSWGVVIISNPQDRRPLVTNDQTTAFLQSFIKLYQGHGGVVTNKNPVIIQGIPDTAKALENTFTAAGNQANFRPQMIMVILPNKNAEVYQRVKKNMDCRFGVVSQCVQASNVVKNQPQYCSNVLMKFNCKLGGTTCTIKAAKPFFNVPTMVIGADVSHAAPGAPQASMAALCVSMDATASRYAAGVQTNGYRVEMIQTKVIEGILKPLIQHWMNTVSKGRLPEHVYYFRDGVSEGQYGPLLKQEIADMKRLFETVANGRADLVPKFTVVVCEKRHHIRFFPKGGLGADKNMNPVPGVIVDRDVTHPFENDVYLCSHAAIQGTARPTHYYMLMDEASVHIDAFQNMLYQHCYQYQRATTPVSLYPAVYYAHLAAARAVAHINKPEMEKWNERRAFDQNPKKFSSEGKDSQAEAPALIEMDNKNGIRYAMWYI